MQILDNILILCLPILAFIAGKRMSDNYNKDRVADLEYQLRLQAAAKGVGYVAPPKKRVQIGQPFMDKLKEHGRAIQQLDNHQLEQQ